MKKYTVIYLNRRGRKGRIGVQAETPEQAVEIFRTEYPQKYGSALATATVLRVYEWRNGHYITVLDLRERPAEIDLPDSVPGQTVEAPELPKVEIPEDWDI